MKQNSTFQLRKIERFWIQGWDSYWNKDGFVWWILSDVGTRAKCQASHSRQRSHKRVTLPDAAQCRQTGSLAFLNGVNCQVHEIFRRWWKVLALTSPREGSPWWLQSSFQLCGTLQMCFQGMSSEQPAEHLGKQRQLHGGRAWWLPRGLIICLSWLTSGSLWMFSQPQKIWKLDPLGMHWVHENPGDSLCQSIHLRLRYMPDRRHPSLITYSHLIQMKT